MRPLSGLRELLSSRRDRLANEHLTAEYKKSDGTCVWKRQIDALHWGRLGNAFLVSDTGNREGFEG